MRNGLASFFDLLFQLVVETYCCFEKEVIGNEGTGIRFFGTA